MSLIATDNFNSYSTIDDMYARTGVLKWSQAEYWPAVLYHDFPRFIGCPPNNLGIYWEGGVYATFDPVGFSSVTVGMAVNGISHAEFGELTGQYNDYEIDFMDGHSPSGSIYQCGVGVSFNSGQITVFDSGGYPWFSTQSGIVPMNTWSFLEVSALIGHIGVGRIAVRLDGKDILSVTGGDFMGYDTTFYDYGLNEWVRVVATPLSNQVRLRSGNNWWGWRVDDFYCAA
jgi:hypothetical protein